jgi:acetyl-CoA carboxylase carboxyltransferase component
MALCSAALATQSTAQARKTVECYCTDKAGSRVELGETRCLSVGGRMFTARCEMSLNVPMWREQQGGCLTG